MLCREFGISRKTGYKILTRYNEIGLEGLADRSRRPYRQANRLPFQIETQIVRLKQDKPSWRAPEVSYKLYRNNLGSSALCNMTWDFSTTRLADWNRSIAPSHQKCYPCLRYKP